MKKLRLSEKLVDMDRLTYIDTFKDGNEANIDR